MLMEEATAGPVRGRSTAVLCGVALLLVVLLQSAAAHASVVQHGYLPLSDGTHLNYTLTLPSAEGRFPVLLQYDPYSAGGTSDPTWNASGYAMLGVNIRGTECSEGTFNPLRADVWGKDGAEVVDWASRQSWSDGNIGMFGYSFTGTSQLATAAFAGPALKAISPGNVFPDFYRDMIYPGGIHNGWIPLWIAARDFALGTGSAAQAPTDPHCAADLAQHVVPNLGQSLDTQNHPYLDGFWSTQPAGLLDRVHVPVLGCVNWQDGTVYSRAFDAFRDQLDPARTWLVGANGNHGDCPWPRATQVRFFDRYLKQHDNGWDASPHVVLEHEVTGKNGVRGTPEGRKGAWESTFENWSDMAAAITPVALHLREGGRLDVAPPAQPEPADRYSYPTPTANTAGDFLTVDHWGPPPVARGTVVYTTPALTADAEFLGDGSADLWVASSATDTDVQVTLSEVRPDGQETYVQNGWLRLSHRRLDQAGSTVLRPLHTDLQRDTEPLTPGTPVPARIHILPFDHVFRAGSAIRLSIDAPGGYFQVMPRPATNTIHHAPGMESKLVLGLVPAGSAHAPLPACGALLDQPCRKSARAVPQGSLTIPRPAAPKLLIGRASGLRGARPGHPFRLAVQAQGGELRDVRITLRDARNRRVGAGGRVTLGVTRRDVRIRVSRRLRPGRYRLAAAAVARDGSRVTATRLVRLRRGG